MSFDTPRGTRGRKSTSNPVVRLVNRFMVRKARRSESAKLGPMRILALTTVGAKSGERREVPVAWFPGGDGSWLVVASANGAARNPAWYHNIAAHPGDVTIEIGDRKIDVTAEQLHGQERADALASIIGSAPNFASYNDKTDREIPVIRLTERPAPQG